jgi:hypothetical protein
MTASPWMRLPCELLWRGLQRPRLPSACIVTVTCQSYSDTLAGAAVLAEVAGHSALVLDRDAARALVDGGSTGRDVVAASASAMIERTKEHFLL